MKYLLLTPALLCFSCGILFPGGSVSDKIAGESLGVSSAIHDENDDILSIVLADRGGLCSRLEDEDARIANIGALSITLFNFRDGAFRDIEEGEYDVIEGFDFGGRSAVISFVKLDDDCDVDESESASEGTVQLDAYDRDGGARGSFDIEIDGDDITGSFLTSECDIGDDANRDNDECEP